MANAPLVRVVNENGECACVHRSLSVCSRCFEATPGLVSVFSVVYLHESDGDDSWIDGKDTYLSPGTADAV